MNTKPPADVSSDERRSVGRLALVLWFGVCIVLAAVVVPTLGAAVGGVGPAGSPERATGNGANGTAAHAAPTERRAEHAEGVVESLFPRVEFSFDVDRGSGLDVRLGTGSTDVRFLDLGGDDGRQTGTISHGAIDAGVARSSDAGLCAVGLRGAGSPLALDVDPDNGSVTAELASKPAGTSNRTAAIDPAEVVRSCSNSTG